MMLAQLSDIWPEGMNGYALWLFFRFAPLLGFLVGILLGSKTYRFKATCVTVAFYLLVAMLYFAVSVATRVIQRVETVWAFVFLLGPIIGLAFIVAAVVSRAAAMMSDANRPLPSGICHKCGYDIRSCNDERCSECGTPFENAEARE